MPNITLLLLTKNEEENLKKWKEWLPKLTRVNEFIAIDDNSTDNTKATLTKLGAKVYDRNLDDNFASQRNFAISKAKNSWVLFIDADEMPSDKLIDFINTEDLERPICYAFKRHLVYIDQTIKFGQALNDYPIRLFNKLTGQYINPIHETFETNRCIVKINKPLLHFSAPSLKIFLEKINIYSTIRARELFQKKTKVNTIAIIFYPLAKFIHIYFFCLGFLDGIPGIIISGCLSFYSFLVRSKLWRLYHA